MKRPRIFVAGHRGMVGSAIRRALEARGGGETVCRDRNELDLTDQTAVRAFFEQTRIDQVYVAAAKVGGIQANNTFPAEFIQHNLAIQTNVIHEAWRAGVARLLFLGSSCIYPREAPQPMTEEVLLTGSLEATNRPYAVAKIAGIEMCDAYRRQYGADFRCAMPTNLYGPGDNFDAEGSHVIPALLRRFHEASGHGEEAVTVWGSGRPRREFLHADDLAEASVFLMGLPESRWRESVPTPHINVGCGEDVSIAELAATIAGITGYRGRIDYDTSRPDGTPRKLLDISRLKSLGWQPRIGLEEGLRATYDWFCRNSSLARGVASG